MSPESAHRTSMRTRASIAVGTTLFLVVAAMWLLSTATSEISVGHGTTSKIAEEVALPILPLPIEAAVVSVSPTDAEGAVGKQPSESAEETGAVRLHASWQGGAAAEGVFVRLTRSVEIGDLLETEPVRTNPTGEIVWEHVPAGRVYLFPDRGNPLVVIVEVGKPSDVFLTLPVGIAVEGIVVDQAGGGVGNVPVYAFQSHRLSGCIPVAHSDGAGRFSIQDIEIGQSLYARAAHVAPASICTIEGVAGEVVNVTLQVEPAGKCQGTVATVAGAPIADALVIAGGAGHWGHQVGPQSDLLRHLEPISVRSSADGRFEVGGLPLGLNRLVARAAGFQPSERVEVEIRVGSSPDVSIVLDVGCEVRGSVANDRGEVVQDAHVQLLVGDIALRSTASSNARGQFVLRGLPCGEQQFICEAPTGRVEATVNLSAGAPNEWHPVLPSGNVLRVSVLGEHDRRPLSGWSIVVQDAEPHSNIRRHFLTNAAGVAEVVANGGLVDAVWAYSPGGSRLTARAYHGPVAVQGRQDIVLLVSDSPGATLRGRVASQEGRIGTGTTVRLRIAGESPMETVILGADGLFEFIGLGVGRYVVEVYQSGGILHQETLEVSGSGVRDVGTIMLRPLGTLTAIGVFEPGDRVISVTVHGIDGTLITLLRLSVDEPQQSTQLPEGTYSIKCRNDSTGLEWSASIAVIRSAAIRYEARPSE